MSNEEKVKKKKKKNKSDKKILEKMIWIRWAITLIVLISFLVLIHGIVASIHMKAEVPQEWKELLLLLLGAFITSYGKIIDFWFSNSKRANDYTPDEKEKKKLDQVEEEQIIENENPQE